MQNTVNTAVTRGEVSKVKAYYRTQKMSLKYLTYKMGDGRYEDVGLQITYLSIMYIYAIYMYIIHMCKSICVLDPMLLSYRKISKSL